MTRGVVLCGGESKRMGRDKGLLSIGSDNWAQLAFKKLSRLKIPVMVSVNETQFCNYAQFFSPDLLVVDQVDVKGPLTGLLSVHLNFPEDDLLVLACDMNEMDTATLKHLQDQATEFPDYDYYVYANEDFLEPLCAIYTSGALKKTLNQGSLPHFSLNKLIKKGNYKVLSIADSKKFNNQNTAIPASFHL